MAGLRRKHAGSDLRQVALRRSLPASDCATGCPEHRLASANQPLGRRWPAGDVGLGLDRGPRRSASASPPPSSSKPSAAPSKPRPRSPRRDPRSSRPPSPPAPPAPPAPPPPPPRWRLASSSATPPSASRLHLPSSAGGGAFALTGAPADALPTGGGGGIADAAAAAAGAGAGGGATAGAATVEAASGPPSAAAATLGAVLGGGRLIQLGTAARDALGAVVVSSPWREWRTRIGCQHVHLNRG